MCHAVQAETIFKCLEPTTYKALGEKVVSSTNGGIVTLFEAFRDESKMKFWTSTLQSQILQKEPPVQKR